MALFSFLFTVIIGFLFYANKNIVIEFFGIMHQTEKNKPIISNFPNCVIRYIQY